MIIRRILPTLLLATSAYAGVQYYSHSPNCLLTSNPRNEITQDSKIEEIQYEKKSINDPNLLVGEVKVNQVGLIGNITHDYSVTYTDCRESVRTEIKTTKKDPQTEITAIGTKEIRQETTIEEIPFGKITQKDYSRHIGGSRIGQAGINGRITRNFNVIYVEGRETSRTETSSERIDPRTEIILKGAAPIGTSAICNDNTYSYSENRSGTCSWHGGVDVWIY